MMVKTYGDIDGEEHTAPCIGVNGRLYPRFYSRKLLIIMGTATGGLLTCSAASGLPTHKGSGLKRTQRLSNLQQRVLFRIYTGFPFLMRHKGN